MQTYIICYTSKENNQTGFALCNNPDCWMDENTNVTVNYIFNADTSIGKNDFSKSRFELNSDRYGIDPAAYGTIIKGTTGDNYRIIDIHPRNHKYPIIAVNLTTMKRYKFTAKFIRERLAKA